MVYICRLKNDQLDVKALVKAADPDAAKSRAMEKFSREFGLEFPPEDLQLLPFSSPTFHAFPG